MRVLYIIYMTVFFLPQSPSSILMSEGGSENPTLKDNWDDAEGYYSKSYSTGLYTEGGETPGYPTDLLSPPPGFHH